MVQGVLIGLIVIVALIFFRRFAFGFFRSFTIGITGPNKKYSRVPGGLEELVRNG